MENRDRPCQGSGTQGWCCLGKQIRIWFLETWNWQVLTIGAMSNLVTSAYGWLFLPLCSPARGRWILNPSVFSPEERLHTFMLLSRLSPSALHHRKLKGWHFFRKLYCPLLAPPMAHPPSPVPLYPSLKPFSHLSRNQNATGEGVPEHLRGLSLALCLNFT